MAKKIILGIESSCDETAVAILKKEGNDITILSNVVSTSLEMQAKYGGVIPEQAAREQLKLIIPAIETALKEAALKVSDIDAIAITQGPGLIGSLLVGVETAKTLSTVWSKPLIPVNHLIGHFYANWINYNNSSPSESRSDRLPKFPCLGLLISGGHSDIVLFKDHGDYDYLGGTRDDAAGECFDKCARVIGFSYPGGPKISKLAQNGDPKKFNLPRPMLDSVDLDFSFSGLKTAFLNTVEKNFKLDLGKYDTKTQTWTQKSLEEQLTKPKLSQINDLCASLEQAIIDCLVVKTIKAAQSKQVEQIIVAGGVAANQNLINQLRNLAQKNGIKILAPPPILCTDNAAMIAGAAFFLKPEPALHVQANPNLSLAY